jgi:hypothetical protein
MDLNLVLTYQEQNDNKAIILTDTTTNFSSSTTNITNGNTMADATFYEIVSRATVDFTSYGAPDNVAGTRFVTDGTTTLGAGDELKPVTPTIAEIEAATLDVTVTGVDETADVKDQVDLYTAFTGPWTLQSELVFTITAALLGDTADTELEDGLYELTYSITYSGDGLTTSKTDTLTVTVLVYGQVKVGTYEKLRSISTLYMCSNGCPNDEIAEADLCGAYLSSIEASAYTAKTEELLDMLVTLDNILENGSNITW